MCVVCYVYQSSVDRERENVILMKGKSSNSNEEFSKKIDMR